jgi:ammonia channel protein AmtB
MLLSGALVFLMIPGISLIHAGSADTKSALSLFRLPLFTLAVVGCQVKKISDPAIIEVNG